MKMINILKKQKIKKMFKQNPKKQNKMILINKIFLQINTLNILKIIVI